jgi:hypothetical protein
VQRANADSGEVSQFLNRVGSFRTNTKL